MNTHKYLLQLGSDYYEDIIRLSAISPIFTDYKLVSRDVNRLRGYISNHQSRSVVKCLPNVVSLSSFIKSIAFNRQPHICFVMPGLPTLLCLAICALFRLNTALILHNQRNFQHDSTIYKKTIVLLCTLLSHKHICFSRHVKESWENRQCLYRQINLKLVDFPYLYDIKIQASPGRNSSIVQHAQSFGFNILPDALNLFMWGRNLPYKGFYEFLDWLIISTPGGLRVNLNVASSWTPSASQLAVLERSKNIICVSSYSLLNLSDIREIGSVHHYVVFPYLQISQSGALRDSIEAGHSLLVNSLSGVDLAIPLQNCCYFVDVTAPSMNTLLQLYKNRSRLSAEPCPP